MNQGTIRGQVNAGCLLFIPDSFTDLQKKDMADAILYTQLAASKKHSRFDDSELWRQTWIAAISRFGGLLVNHESFSLLRGDLPTDTFWGWIGKFCPPAMAPELFEHMQEVARRSLLQHPRQPALALLKHQALSASGEPSGTRHVGLQLAGHDPLLGLCLVVLSFKTTQAIDDDLLAVTLEPEKLLGNVELTFYTVQMNEMLYGLYRERIDQALAERRAQSVSLLRETAHVTSN